MTFQNKVQSIVKTEVLKVSVITRSI